MTTKWQFVKELSAFSFIMGFSTHQSKIKSIKKETHQYKVLNVLAFKLSPIVTNYWSSNVY